MNRINWEKKHFSRKMVMHSYRLHERSSTKALEGHFHVKFRNFEI